MALHGEVWVNGHCIAAWSAVRQEELRDTEAFHDYDCSVAWAEPRREVRFPLRHQYSKGGTALAAEVLRTADRLAGAQ